ncbi:DEAD/DEAH box helicase [Microbacterium sp. X-17]|uniref:DEAD/DEAH box helicase n=1 Tax=Microbacterium sp. X-17 TaxID=3144404 RepID=UPI0031F4815F
MPKNKKPAGGRPAQNFDPRRGAKPNFQDAKRRGDARPATGADKPGSRSPGHRGYRPETDEAPVKRRWTAQEKAGRDEARAIRSRTDGDRAPRRTDRDDRAPRAYGRDDRAPRGYGRDDRAPRTYDRDARSDRPTRDDRANRGYARDERPRSYDRDDRAPRAYGRDDRAPRASERDDRAPRANGQNDRARSFDRNERPRSFDGDGRPRSFDRDDRAPRRDDRGLRRDDRAPRAYGQNDRARSFDRDDRPRSFDGESRPRSFDRDDRAPRRYDGGDRTRAPRSDDRAPRRYDRDDRAPRRYDRDDRAPRRDDRAPRRDDRAPRNEEHIDVVHERLQAEAVEATTTEGVGFAELGLGENIVRELVELGAAHPFPIQAATVAPILEGRDVLARGRTGSGKTIAFGAPLVEAVLRAQAGQKREYGRSPRALIMAPTRELALQIDRTVQRLARSVGLFTTQIYGGVPQARQVGALKKGVDIVIGTPGRIEDLERQGHLDLSQVQVAVLDEADHMCELGFLEPVQRILRLTADGSQKLLFSATLDREVAELVDEFLVEPAVYEVAGETQDSGTIDHRVFVIDHRDKAEILGELVDREGKTLVFARTRAYAEMLAEQFDGAGISAVALHGDLNQAKRTRNLERLTSGRVRVLVATDVAARGIHVDDIDLVIQADAPDEFKTYLHRSGRTGRAGRSGTVVTLIPRQRRRRMTELLGRAEIEAPFEDVRPGDDAIEELAGRPTAESLTA